MRRSEKLPRGQQVLAPFLLGNPEKYCFCPVGAVEEWGRQASRLRARRGSRLAGMPDRGESCTDAVRLGVMV